MVQQSHILVPAALVVAAALAGLFVGLRGRRRGAEPHCRRCGYDLTGLTSARCPECGADVTAARAVVHGRRVRRWRLAAVSMLALVLASTVSVAVLSGWASRVEWTRFAPYTWLRWRALDGRMEELKELERRYLDNELSDANTADLIESLLAAYHAGEPKAACAEFARVLRAVDRAKGLTVEQRDRFYRDMAEVRVLARSPIRAGDPLPIALVRLRQSPPDGSRLEVVGRFWTIDRARINGGEWVRIDGHMVVVGDGQQPYGVGLPSEPIVLGATGARTGMNKVSVVVTSSLRFAGLPMGNAAGSVVSEREATWTAPPVVHASSFEVLAVGSSDPLRMVHDPTKEQEIRSAVLHTTVRVMDFSDVGPILNWNPSVIESRLPIDVALQAVVRAGGQEFAFRPIAARRGRPFRPPLHKVRVYYDRKSNAEFDAELRRERDAAAAVAKHGGRLILRADPDVARQSVDIFEIWDGEIDLGPIEVADRSK